MYHHDTLQLRECQEGSMDYKMSKFDIDRIACLMYRDIAAYIDDQRKQSSDCGDAAVRKEEKQNASEQCDHQAGDCIACDPR